MNHIFRALTRLSFLLALSGSYSWAYYDVLDNGEILPRGTYKLMGDAQLLTDQGGLDAQATIDTGFSEDFGGRALVGFGRTDYYVGFLAKWMPIPDVANQPAVGFNIGLLYGHYNGLSEMTVRWEPLISKKFKVESVMLTPYLSLPVGIRVHNSANADAHNTTDISWQLALGSQLQVERWKNIQFIGEVGVEFSHAPSYITLGAIWYFDDQNGFQVK